MSDEIDRQKQAYLAAVENQDVPRNVKGPEIKALPKNSLLCPWGKMSQWSL